MKRQPSPSRGGAGVTAPYDSRLTAAQGRQARRDLSNRTSKEHLCAGSRSIHHAFDHFPNRRGRPGPGAGPGGCHQGPSPTTFRSVLGAGRRGPRRLQPRHQQLGGSWAASPPNSCRPTWAAIPTRPASWSRATCSARRSISSPARSARTWRWPWAPLFAAKVPYLSNNPGPSQFGRCNPYWFAPVRTTLPRGRRQGRGRTAASRRCSSWPRLSGGQGCAQRLQARLQGPGRRGLPSWARSTTRPSWRRSARPDAVYIFLPGGMGINFVKQFVSAGLSQSIKLIGPGFSADRT